MFGLFGDDEKKIKQAIADKDYESLPTEVIEIITAECVCGMNLPRDFFAGGRDIFGGRSAVSRKVLRDSRRTCLTEPRREALMAGADAPVAVDPDDNEISGDGKSMLFVVATGTAVRARKT